MSSGARRFWAPRFDAVRCRSRASVLLCRPRLMSADRPTIQVLCFCVLFEPQRSAVSIPEAPGARPLVVATQEGLAGQSCFIAAAPILYIGFAGRGVVRHRRYPTNTERCGR